MKRLLGGFLLVLHTSLAWGQAKTPPGEGWQTIFFESPTTTLPLLTAAAIQHSAALKGLEIEKAISAQELKLTKQRILETVAFGGSYTYGNLASVGPADPSNPNQFNTFSSGRYSTGVTFGLPLGQIVSRGTQIKQQELTYQRTESQRQAQEDVVRQQLIPLYQNVLLARKLLTLQQEGYVTVQTTYQLAEKRFRQGQLSLPEISEANSQLTAAAIAQETARSQYDTAFLLLEEVVGAKISSLLNTP